MNAKDVNIVYELISRLLKFLTVSFLFSFTTDWDVLSETLCGVLLFGISGSQELSDIAKIRVWFALCGCPGLRVDILCK